ncbi:MAG: DNA cytosine methyltransferase [Prevotella sp.]|nr:DNA cytosine methyltransferase [Prevotella sp.]
MKIIDLFAGIGGIRLGVEQAAKAAGFKQISYKTGIPFGQLYTEAMADLVRKYNSK